MLKCNSTSSPVSWSLIKAVPNSLSFLMFIISFSWIHLNCTDIFLAYRNIFSNELLKVCADEEVWWKRSLLNATCIWEYGVLVEWFFCGKVWNTERLLRTP